MFKGQRDQRAERLGLRGSQSCALQFELLETLQAALSPHHTPTTCTEMPLPQPPFFPKARASLATSCLLRSLSLKQLLH